MIEVGGKVVAEERVVPDASASPNHLAPLGQMNQTSGTFLVSTFEVARKASFGFVESV